MQRLASIDAFLDLADAGSRRTGRRRFSLPPSVHPGTRDRDLGSDVERALLFSVVVLLHVAMLFALRAAMRPPVLRADDRDVLQIVFLAPHRPFVPRAETAAGTRSADRAIAPTPTSPRRNARRMATVPERGSNAQPVIAVPSPRAVLFGPDGALRAPAGPKDIPPRDLLAHRHADWMLPGGGRPGAQELRFEARLTPQRALERVGALFGGGPFDPCPDIARDMIDLNDATAREQAEERFERSCEWR